MFSELFKITCLFCLPFILFLENSVLATESEPSNVTKVEVVKIVPRSFKTYATYVGHLTPLKRVTVSTEIAGTFDSANFSLGQKIKKGQILVTINTHKLELNKKLNQSNYNLALIDFQREKSLYAKNLSTMSKIATLKNRLEVNRYRLELSILDLVKSKVRSPLAGLVKAKFIEKGEYIGVGKKIAEIMDISSVLALINVPEHEIRYAKTGKKVKMSLDAFPGKTFTGIIKTVGLEADTKSRSFAVEVEAKNHKQRLLPGMLVRVEMLTVSLNRQIIIPRHAIQEEEQGSFVFLVNSRKAKKRNIKTGISIGNEVQVLSGLKFGDYLIETGQQLITAQEAVNIVKTRKQNP